MRGILEFLSENETFAQSDRADTTHSGALDCFAYGVGTTEMANAFMTDAIRLNRAESLLIGPIGKNRAPLRARGSKWIRRNAR